MTLNFNLQAQSFEIYGNYVYATRHYEYRNNNFFKGFGTNNFGLNYYINGNRKTDYVFGISYDKKGASYNYSPRDTVSFRFNYVTLKALGRRKIVKNNELQFGFYAARLTNIEVTPLNVPYTNGYLDEYRNTELGLTFVFEQSLFSFKQFETLIRGEANYGLTTIWGQEYFLHLLHYKRNITLGIGAAIRWNYKEKE